MTLSTSCQEENLSIQVVKTSILNEESRRKTKVSCPSQSQMWLNIPAKGGTDREIHRGEKNLMPNPSPEVSLVHAFIVENQDTSRRTKVPQRMSNLERFLRKRARQLLLQVSRRSCSFVSKHAQILQVKSALG